MSTFISLQNVSKSRTELMGYSMLGVLLGHIIDLGHVEQGAWTSFLCLVCYWMHTSGFLFLSGFGIYYSLHKNGNVKAFYFRRFFRFFLPFLIYALPFWTAVMIFKHETIWFWVRCLTTIEFWFNGNYMGMWYIAVSLLLYIISPPIIRFVHGKKNIYSFIYFLSLISISIAIDYLISIYMPLYYDKVWIGISKIPFYFIGILYAFICELNFRRKNEIIIIFIIIALGLYPMFISNLNLYNGFRRIICCALCLATFFIYIKQYPFLSSINSFFSWFGTYSLELYILHLYFYGVIGILFDFSSLLTILIAIIISIIICKPAKLLSNEIGSLLKTRLNIQSI